MFFFGLDFSGSVQGMSATLPLSGLKASSGIALLQISLQKRLIT